MTNIYLCDKFTPTNQHFVPPASSFLARDKSEFSIAVAADAGSRNRILEAVIKNAVRSDKKYDFMLYLGDMVSSIGGPSMSWMLYEIHPQLRGMPMYTTPGNHDVERKGIVDKNVYRSVLGASYYWFGYGNVMFISVDSAGPYIEDEQFVWLENVLKNIRPLFKHCVIYTHKPPRDFRPELLNDHALDAESAARLEKIVRRHRITAMLFGHVHYYHRDTFAGIPVYVAPSSGQRIRSPIKKYGYLGITFNKNGIKSVEPIYIDFQGSKKEYIEAWFAKHVFSHRVRKLINGLAIAATIFFMMALYAWIVQIRRAKKAKR